MNEYYDTHVTKLSLIFGTWNAPNKELQKEPAFFVTTRHESRFVRDPHIEMTLCKIWEVE